jgi:hypothetical protein
MQRGRNEMGRGDYRKAGNNCSRISHQILLDLGHLKKETI